MNSIEIETPGQFDGKLFDIAAIVFILLGVIAGIVAIA